MSQLLDIRDLPEGLKSTDRLPSLPGVALEVLNLCKDDDTTLDDLANVLSKDPALSARLLRFANSSLYNLGQEVTTIQRASLVLGMKTVQLMSLSFSLAESLPRNGETGGFDYQEFWRRSLICAVAGRSLAGLAGMLGEEEAFLCGLLSHIGQIVMAECLPDEFALVHEAAAGIWPSAKLEGETLGFDHSDLGASLLNSWGLPEIVTASVGAMHDPDRLNDSASIESLDFVRVMNMAGLTVDLLTRDDKGSYLSKLEDRGQEWLGLPAESIYSYITSLESDIAEASELLNLELPQGDGHEKIIDDARQQLLQISIGPGPKAGDARVGSSLPHRKRILCDPELLDPVSGVPSQQAFTLFFEQELIARTEGHLRRPMGIALMEIDEFDEMVSALGSRVGDKILHACGQSLHTLVRAGDLPAHFGGGLFALLMSEGTPYGLRALAERARRGVAKMSIEVEGHPLKVTATVAGACLGRVTNKKDGVALLAAVEKMLTRAKSTDRNHVQIHPKLLGSREG
ncbi:MAG: diguanylate cyclase (GGDEF)-like protein [Planctomycetota bacterium]|jgi:diguanylate cyclase (GGDEF)-like protein